MTFIFKSIHSHSNTITVKKFEAETLPEIFSQFEDFIRGNGFVFDGKIVLEDELDYETMEQHQ